jgi:hypothetical protein
MEKVKVLLLSGCKLCHALTTMLDDNKIFYVPLNADNNGTLCDTVEVLLNTINYPIVIIDIDGIQTYIYRVDKTEQLGRKTIDDQTVKVGCLDNNRMLDEILTILNK